MVATDEKDKTDGRHAGAAGEAATRTLAATPEDREEKKLGEGLGKATKFWAVFEKDQKEYDAATEAERKEKKLKDPRFISTFVVEQRRTKDRTESSATRRPRWPRSGRSSC